MICIYDIKLFLVEVVENIYLEPGKFLSLTSPIPLIFSFFQIFVEGKDDWFITKRL